MPDVGADGAPAVGVTLVAERTQQHPYIAVRLVYITLVVFLGHHPLLDIQHSPMVALGVPVASHTVGFKLQGLLEIFGGEGEIVVGIVVVGESVAFTTHGIDDTVEVGEAAGAAEHEVLEQVGETSALGTLVASPDTIHHVDGYQRCGIVAVRQHRQPIAQHMPFVFYHKTAIKRQQSIIIVFFRQKKQLIKKKHVSLQIQVIGRTPIKRDVTDRGFAMG